MKKLPIEELAGFWREIPRVKKVLVEDDDIEAEVEGDVQGEGKLQTRIEVNTVFHSWKGGSSRERFKILMDGNSRLDSVGRSSPVIFARAQVLQNEISQLLLHDFRSKRPGDAAGTGNASGGLIEHMKANALGAKAISKDPRPCQRARDRNI